MSERERRPHLRVQFSTEENLEAPPPSDDPTAWEQWSCYHIAESEAEGTYKNNHWIGEVIKAFIQARDGMPNRWVRMVFFHEEHMLLSNGDDRRRETDVQVVAGPDRSGYSETQFRDGNDDGWLELNVALPVDHDKYPHYVNDVARGEVPTEISVPEPAPEEAKPEPPFKKGDRVRRISECHTLQGSNYRDLECRKGWVGLVVATFPGESFVSVIWDESGMRSRIDTDNLEPETKPRKPVRPPEERNQPGEELPKLEAPASDAFTAVDPVTGETITFTILGS